jgi:hypothetical protein
MPESGRPDIDAHNATVWFLDKLRPQIAADVDWSSNGIDNGTLVIDWLSRYGAGAVAATITATVARRRQTRPDDKIPVGRDQATARGRRRIVPQPKPTGKAQVGAIFPVAATACLHGSTSPPRFINHRPRLNRK